MTMADTVTGTDITDLVLVEHDEFRSRFASLWVMRGEGDVAARAVAWRVLANLLEVHATAEEEILYPVLLKRGSGQAPAETVDAIRDHNQIRDAIKLAARVASGTDFWWAAVQACRTANDEHLAEEERDVIPDFRLHTDVALRRKLGARWQEFHAVHGAARGISDDDVDPAEFVRDNS
ncbi:MAG: hemerythrin domain-containing protein [Actinomycetota bacterium]|nr:hemerythrin domain-containing protein [Actinomycetota bacterium]